MDDRLNNANSANTGSIGNTGSMANTGHAASTGTGGLDNQTTGQLMHLSEMDDYEISDGEPDIRGWDVRAVNGDKIGDVEDLLVDTATLRVRYVEVKLEKDLVSNNERRHALIPIGSARLDDDKDDVLVSLDSERLRALPPYVRGALSRDYEQSVIDGFTRPEGRVVSTNADRDFYDDEHFDDRRMFEARRELGRRDDSYLRRTGE